MAKQRGKKARVLNEQEYLEGVKAQLEGHRVLMEAEWLPIVRNCWTQGSTPLATSVVLLDRIDFLEP